MALSDRRPVRTDIVLRAAAILIVALNHAVDMVLPNDALNGGMSVLMMLSGLSFAQLALAGGSGERARETLIRFAIKLFGATQAVLVITTPVRETNVLTPSGFVYTFTELPFWYGAQMAAICLVLAGVFAIPPVARAFFRRPATASLILLAGALAIHAISSALWDTSLFENRLPHLIVWNFVLGWALYFLLQQKRTVAALALAVLSAAIGWGLKSDAGYLVFGAAMVVLVPQIRLGMATAHFTRLVAQATFFLYLTSWIFIVAIGHGVLHLRAEPDTGLQILAVVAAWIGGVAASLALCFGWTATARAYAGLRRNAEATGALVRARG